MDDLFNAVLNLIDTNIVGFKEELKTAISEYIGNNEIKKRNS
jgi:hypothetical protein